MSYDHVNIEKQCQYNWEIDKEFEPIDGHLPKLYLLPMFPYPSGDGLHVGHIRGYTFSDVYARFMRMKGYNVLYPIGWDSFGLPAEQYAIKNGQHPNKTTTNNINNFRRQLKSIGFSFAWEREITTSEPKYYRWTQWIFSLMYKSGLAKEDYSLVNYCPSIGAVLSNEEVVNSRSVDGGYEVIKQPIRQWILKITAYADRLVDDLSKLDWPKCIKDQQTFWIGRKHGVTITFKLDNGDTLNIFTTRCETIFGTTFLGISKRHPLVDKLFINCDDIYEDNVCYKGISTGLFASISILGNKNIPVFVCDYVSHEFGVGAIMGVPAHDENDRLFASKHNIASNVVLSEDDVICSDWYVGTTNINGLKDVYAREIVARFLEENKLCRREKFFRLRDWVFSRQRYWGEPIPIVHNLDGSKFIVEDLPLELPHLIDYRPPAGGISPLESATDWMMVCDGNGKEIGVRETNTMPQWAGSCWYFLRFCDPNNYSKAFDEQKEAFWMPVDVYVGGGEHAVLHLLYARFWQKFLFDKGLVSTDEPFKSLKVHGLMSARSYKFSTGGYLHESEVTFKDGKYYQTSTGVELISNIDKMGKSKLNGISPESVMADFGADALRAYTMFMGPMESDQTWNINGLSGCKRFLNKVYRLWSSGIVKECTDSPDVLNMVKKTAISVLRDYESWSFNTIVSTLMEFINFAVHCEQVSYTTFSIFIKLLFPICPHICEYLWLEMGRKSSLHREGFPIFEESDLVSDDATCEIVICVNGKKRDCVTVPIGTKEEDVINVALASSSLHKWVKDKTIKNKIFVQDKLLNIVVG